jgi:hypothetical protein
MGDERPDPGSRCQRCDAHLRIFPDPAGDERPVSETMLLCHGCLRDVARSTPLWDRRKERLGRDGWRVNYRNPAIGEFVAYCSIGSPTFRIKGPLAAINRAFAIA